MTLSDQLHHACLSAKAARDVGDDVGADYWHEQVTILSDRMDRQAGLERAVVREVGVS